MWTRKPASLTVRQHEAITFTNGDGQKATHELQTRYLTVTKATIRVKAAELAATTMKPGRDTDDYLTEPITKRAEVDTMGKPMPDRQFKGIVHKRV